VVRSVTRPASGYGWLPLDRHGLSRRRRLSDTIVRVFLRMLPSPRMIESPNNSYALTLPAGPAWGSPTRRRRPCETCSGRFRYVEYQYRRIISFCVRFMRLSAGAGDASAGEAGAGDDGSPCARRSLFAAEAAALRVRARSSCPAVSASCQGNFPVGLARVQSALSSSSALHSSVLPSKNPPPPPPSAARWKYNLANEDGTC
jgi:hypothetical protein